MKQSNEFNRLNAFLALLGLIIIVELCIWVMRIAIGGVL